MTMTRIKKTLFIMLVFLLPNEKEKWLDVFDSPDSSALLTISGKPSERVDDELPSRNYKGLKYVKSYNVHMLT